MSCYHITLENGHKVARSITSAEEYKKIRNSSMQQANVRQVRMGNTKAKMRLAQFNYSCMPNDDGTLKGAKRMTTTIGMDVDHIPAEKMEEVKKCILAKKEELGLLMLELSARREGYHLVFHRKTELTQEENLRWASDLLGVEYDKGAKDITRVFFATTASEEDLLYLDEKLFINADTKAKANTKANTKAKAKANAKANDLDDGGGAIAMVYHDFPYCDIIAKYWELFNDGNLPVAGDRNVKTYELCVTIAPICNYSQRSLEAIVPKYDGFPEEEWRHTIENALKAERRGMPYRLRKVLDEMKNERKLALLGGKDGFTSLKNGNEGALPQRPKHMPELLKLLSSKVPMKYKAMVEEAVWPAMCAHLKGVTFRYIDGVIHEANISSPLIGRQSSGKGAVNMPIELLLADITARDRENENRLLDWRRRNQCKGTTKDRQPRPEDIVIQRLDDDLTPAALSQALIDAEKNGNRRVITKVDEIELLNRIGNGKNDTVGVLVRYGWDSARWGQRRVGLDSVNGSYTVRWVWNASCTLKSARRFLTNAWVADGSLSRLNVNALFLSEDDHEMPKIEEYDEKFINALKLYVERLNAASGLIECQQANRLAKEMKDEHDRIADLCESEGYRTLSYRAVIIGWLKAMILFIVNGYKWDKVIAEYVKYSVRRDMYLKMYFFGQQIEDEFDEEERQQHSGPQNLLCLLQDEFTYDDFLLLRKSQGRRGDGKSTLRTWKARGYIDYDEVTGKYIKISNGHGNNG